MALDEPTGSVPIADVSTRRQMHHQDAPYQLFIAASLALGLLGGFMLALLLPLARALEWDWGARWPELAQAHGQLQLLGFAGLFIASMAFRLMPRFSGRPLAYPLAAHSVVALIGSGAVVRSVAPFFDHQASHDTLFIAGAALLLAGSIAFAAVIVRTLAHPESKAEAAAWFFVLGAASLVAAGCLHLVLAVRAADAGRRLLAADETNALVALELYGFVLMFIGGIATRALTTLAGHPRSQIIARCAAVALAVGAGTYATVEACSAFDEPSPGLARMADVALLVVAAAMLLIVWATGLFHPRANRVAAASQAQFWFARTAMGWLLVTALLLAWYAAGKLNDARVLDQYQVDGVRHLLTLGVVTMMIVGMAMLVVPEFAGRRLQHPGEGVLTWTLFVALNAATALRAWPALEGVGWLNDDRYWPMAAAGGLAIGVVAVFATIFAQSYYEQRRSDWATPEALRGRAPSRR